MSDIENIAYLIKRTHFGVDSKYIEEMTELGWEEALIKVVDEATPPVISSNLRLKNYYLDPDEKDYYDKDFYLILEFELERLRKSSVGLGDRMLWFWHGVLTSGYSEVDLAALLFRQHKLLAKHALGNYRQMLIDITTDAAMLTYLSGDGSTGNAPNENYARELMELFSLGQGNYQQADVKAAARALSGWYLEGYPEDSGEFDPNDITVHFDSASAYKSNVTFLGKTAKFDVESVIDRILEQDACARFIVKRLFQYFVHLEPTNESITRLAKVFQNSEYEIKPLLSALFREPEFKSPKALIARARLPLETLLATASAFATSVNKLDFKSYFGATGFWPFDPPNVAGWPLDDRWLSAPQSLARTKLALKAFDLSDENAAVKAVISASDPIKEVFKRTSLYNVSTKTRSQLEKAAKSVKDPDSRARTLLSLAIVSPEFALA